MPDNYEVYENPNAQVFLIKEIPKAITEAEKGIVEKQLKALKSFSRYKIDIRGKVITIFQSDQDIDAMQEIIGSFSMLRPRPDVDLQGLLQKTVTYSPIMRFTLEDEDARAFVAQRYCFRGSIDDWIYIGGPDPLTVVAKKLMPRLGQESFFELY